MDFTGLHFGGFEDLIFADYCPTHLWIALQWMQNDDVESGFLVIKSNAKFINL
jgi:hypothetical protein